jgi:hypothetical protein
MQSAPFVGELLFFMQEEVFIKEDQLAWLEWVRVGVFVGILCGLGSGSLVHLPCCFSVKEQSFGDIVVIAFSVEVEMNFWFAQTWLSWFNSEGQKNGVF